MEKPKIQGDHMHETRGKNNSGQQILLRINITTIITVGHTDTTPVTHTSPKIYTGKNMEQMKEEMQGNPMGGSQNNKARLW